MIKFEISDTLKSIVLPSSYWIEDGKSYSTLAFAERCYQNCKKELPPIFQELQDKSNGRAYKIYRYVYDRHIPDNLDEFPGHVVFPDQLRQPLIKHKEIVRGERVLTSFYADYDYENKTFLEPVVDITYKYIRDDEGAVTQRIKKVEWYLENGQKSEQVKILTTPFIDRTKQRDEMKRRRANVVLEAEELADGFGLSAAIKAIYTKYAAHVTTYIEGGTADLANALGTETSFEWLEYPTRDPNITVRDFLVDYFTIGVN